MEVHVRFGRDALKEVEPRGVLSFYRRTQAPITPKEQIRIDLASREIIRRLDNLTWARRAEPHLF